MLKNASFLQKNRKNRRALGVRPQTPLPPAAGALPNPQHPTAGGFALRPLLASGGWSLRI